MCYIKLNDIKMLYDSSVHIYIYCLKKHIPINSYNHIMLFDFKKDQ